MVRPRERTRRTTQPSRESEKACAAAARRRRARAGIHWLTLDTLPRALHDSRKVKLGRLVC
eukprot:7294041-Prymnesium_polylepis.1